MEDEARVGEGKESHILGAVEPKASEPATVRSERSSAILFRGLRILLFSVLSLWVAHEPSCHSRYCGLEEHCQSAIYQPGAVSCSLVYLQSVLPQLIRFIANCQRSVLFKSSC
jgi:hypothetical protein